MEGNRWHTSTQWLTIFHELTFYDIHCHCSVSHAYFKIELSDLAPISSGAIHLVNIHLVKSTLSQHLLVSIMLIHPSPSHADGNNLGYTLSKKLGYLEVYFLYLNNNILIISTPVHYLE